MIYSQRVKYQPGFADETGVVVTGLAQLRQYGVKNRLNEILSDTKKKQPAH